MKNQGKFAKKSLGQNFLTDQGVLDRILERAGDLAGHAVLEIGPGLGALTERLLGAGAQLTAVELDDRVLPILREKFSCYADPAGSVGASCFAGATQDKPEDSSASFRLIHGSILDQDLESLFDQKKYSIVANIPYHITAPILRKILSETDHRADKILLMVQKEVGEKVFPKVKKGKVKRSILSIAVEVYATGEVCFVVPRTAFEPVPKVDSAIIEIVPRETPLVSKAFERDFFTVVNAGFHEKRKKLGNSLGKFFGVSSSLLLGSVDPNLRAEDLSIEQWIEIAENFRENVG